MDEAEAQLAGAFADKVAKEIAEGLARQKLPTDPVNKMARGIPSAGPMSEEDIRNHWLSWALEYGTALRATTKRPSAKTLEIDALDRCFRSVGAETRSLTVLEIGCGNGHNCVELAKRFSLATFTGIDYISEMISAARANAESAGVSIQFREGNALALDAGDFYNIIFTDRCLINLNTIEKQKSAIDQMQRSLSPDGHLIMIENSWQTYERQNDCREIVGLHRRVPEKFNLFLDDSQIVPYLNGLFGRVEIEDFITFHDLVLYVLTPLLCDGKVDHDHPIVDAATKINIGISAVIPSAFGAFGQNRLYHCWQPRTIADIAAPSST